MKLLNHVAHEFASWKWFFFILFLLPYSFKNRNFIVAEATVYQLLLNKWDVVLDLLNDPFLMLYLALPLFLFSFSNIVLTERRDDVLMRTGSYTGWIVYTVKKIIPTLIVFFSLCLLVSSLVTVKIPFDFNWSDFSTQSTPGNYRIYQLQQYIDSPSTALFSQVILLFFFFLFIHCLLATVHLFFHSKQGILLVNIVVFSGILVSFKKPPSEWMWLQVLNYIFPAYAYANLGSLLPALFVLGLGISLCFGVVVYFKTHWIEKAKKRLKEHYLVFSFLLVCILGISSSALNFELMPQTVWDLFYLRFYGVSETGYTLLSYLFFCLVFLGIVFYFQDFMNKQLSSQAYYLLIRYKSMNVWFLNLLKGMAGNLLKFLFFLFALVLAIGVLQGKSVNMTFSIDVPITVIEMSYHYFVNGFLQIFNYILLAFIVRCIWKEPIYSVLILAVFILGGLPFIHQGVPVPFGLNALGSLTGDANEIYYRTGILGVYLLGELGIIACIFNKRKNIFY